MFALFCVHTLWSGLLSIAVIGTIGQFLGLSWSTSHDVAILFGAPLGMLIGALAVEYTPE
jgi:hypothetical protein